MWRPFLLDQPVLPRWGLGHYFHLAGGDRATESWRRATFAGGVGRAGRGAPGSISIWSASTRLLVDQPISWLPLNHNCDAVLNNWSATPNLPCRSVLQYKLGDFFFSSNRTNFETKWTEFCLAIWTMYRGYACTLLNPHINLQILVFFCRHESIKLATEFTKSQKNDPKNPTSIPCA